MAARVWIVMEYALAEPSKVFSTEAKARKYLNAGGYRREGSMYFLVGEDKSMSENTASVTDYWVE